MLSTSRPTLRWSVTVPELSTFRVDPLYTGLVLAAAHVLVTAWRLQQTWWWQDDLSMLGTVAGRPLTLDLLTRDYHGHLQPATWLLAWAITHTSTMAWAPAALVTLAMVAAIDVMLLLLLCRLFGRHQGILAPYVIYLGTPLTLFPTLWWAAAMQWLPTSLSLVTALYCHVRYVAEGRARFAAGAVLAVVAGLLFFEKAATVIPLLAFYTIAYCVEGPLPRRIWRAVRRFPRYWTAQAVVLATYTALYLRNPVNLPSVEDASDVVELAREMILDTFFPGLLGGPLRWTPVTPDTVAALPLPPPWLRVLAAVVVALTVGLSCLLRRGAWRAWVLLAAFLAISVDLVARTRLGLLGPVIGRDSRYLCDVALFASVCLGLATLPLRPGLDASAHGTASGPARRRVPLAGVVTLVVALIAVCGLVSTQRFMPGWRQNPAKSYLANLSQDVAASAGPVAMFDQNVPQQMMLATFENGENRLSHVTRPLADRPVITTWAPTFMIADPTGHLHPGTVSGSSSSSGQPDQCSTASRPSVTTTLLGPQLTWPWVVKVAYLAGQHTPATLEYGTGRVPIELEKGLHVVYVQVTGAGNAVRISGLSPFAPVCVGQVTVGTPVTG